MYDDTPRIPSRPSGYCPRVQWASELIGSRWTSAILLVLLAGARRFSDIRDAIPGLSDRLLWERLRRLQAEGLVTRQPAGPATADYAPTPQAEELEPLLRELGAWAARWEVTRQPQPADADPRGR